MNLSPGSSDGIVKRVTEQHRATRSARIDALETEIVNLKALAALLHSRVLALRAEVAGDETTVRIRELPETKQRRERPYLD